MKEEISQVFKSWEEVFNTSTYRLNAIKKVCYQFSSSFSVKIDKIDSENVNVIFNFPEPIDDKQ